MNAPSASMISGQTPLQRLSPSAAEDTEELDESLLPDHLTEWPPSTSVLCVFSSRTGRWEERVFAREGNAAGTVADMPLQEYSMFWRGCAVYWCDALYAHCNGGDFVVSSVCRISLSGDKYRVINMPSDIELIDHSDIYLGKSAKGVSGAYFRGRYHLQVWLLDESRDQIEWVLKHHINIMPILRVLNHNKQQKTEGPRIVQDVNNDEDERNEVEKKLEWDSDNDGLINIEYGADQHCYGRLTFLGFHPYKDVSS